MCELVFSSFKQQMLDITYNVDLQFFCSKQERLNRRKIKQEKAGNVQDKIC